MPVAAQTSAFPEGHIPSYYRARYYDPAVGRFLSEDPIRFDAGPNFFSYTGNDSSNLTDPSGMLQLCCRPARSVTWLGLHGCHCFLKLSDGTTLGGYFKLFSRDTTWGLLEKRQDFKEDKYPTDPPDCKDLPGSECAVRRSFASLPRFEPYGLGGTSNSIPALTLLIAGVPFALPDCAWGANPFNTQPWNHAPVPISSIPNVRF
jgi:RHS repeat-associated protein